MSSRNCAIFGIFITGMQPYLQHLSYSYLAIIFENILACLWYFSNIKWQTREHSFAKFFKYTWSDFLKKSWAQNHFLYDANFHKDREKLSQKGDVQSQVTLSVSHQRFVTKEGTKHKCLGSVWSAFDCRTFCECCLISVVWEYISIIIIIWKVNKRFFFLKSKSFQS